jgi:hypothetical protein
LSGDGKPIVRSWGMRVTDAIDAGAHVVAKVTNEMREVYPVPDTA